MSLKNGFVRFLPPIIWMVVIFTLSSRTSLPSNQVYEVDFTIKKTMHALEYLILYLLWSFAFEFKNFTKPFYFSVFYSFLDETHQLFVPTRTGLLRDTIFDFIGILLGYLIINRLGLWKKDTFRFAGKILKK